ncbi:MAG: hypothetical protein LBQ08_04660 [Holosporaceae bacterium]|nr:hypothetical protein [Holosporaceae bacterium]
MSRYTESLKVKDYSITLRNVEILLNRNEFYSLKDAKPRSKISNTNKIRDRTTF